MDTVQVAATRDELRGNPPLGAPGLLEPRETIVSWGRGWGPPEPWGRWMFAREGHLQVRGASAGAHLHFEATTWEGLGVLQEVIVASGDSVLCRIIVSGFPWKWQPIDVGLPGTGSPLELVVRVSRTTTDAPPGHLTRGLPVRDLVVK